MNSVSVLQSENKLVDVTGIEPVTPCLQSVNGARATSAYELLQPAIRSCLRGLRAHRPLLHAATSDDGS
jgi:hypothetical protein